jgi:hypothetical protein
MTTVDAPSRGKSLVARFFGILFSPRETYTDVVAVPRVAGMMILVLGLTAAVQFTFFSTEVGQQAMQAQFEESIRQSRAQGQEPSPEALQTMQTLGRVISYVSALAQLVFGPLFIALFALIIRGVGNAFLGVESTFKQAYAVMTHSGVITAVGSIFTFGMMFMRGDMTSPTNLGVFFPMLDQTGFLSYLIRTVDLLYVWAFINLAIGMAVLYKSRTGPVATTLLGIYAVVSLIIATVRSL